MARASSSWESTSRERFGAASAWVEGGFTGMFDFPLYYAMTDVFCRGAHPGKIAAILGADRLYPLPESR